MRENGRNEKQDGVGSGPSAAADASRRSYVRGINWRRVEIALASGSATPCPRTHAHNSGWVASGGGNQHSTRTWHRSRSSLLDWIGSLASSTASHKPCRPPPPSRSTYGTLAGPAFLARRARPHVSIYVDHLGSGQQTKDHMYKILHTWRKRLTNLFPASADVQCIFLNMPLPRSLIKLASSSKK
jgi:hypothetical protein